MKIKEIYIILLLCCIPTGAIATSSNIPLLVNYQGKLTDANGTELATKDYTLTFRIYDAPINGNLIWGPQVFDGATALGHGDQVPVVKGHFNVILGPQDVAGSSIDNAFVNESAYIEITVDDGTNNPVVINPRQQILSAPYAINAEMLGGGAVTVDGSGDVHVPGNVYVTGTLNADTINYNGSTGAVSVSSNGNVGMGTSSPTVKLDVVGNIKVSGDFSATGNAHSNCAWIKSPWSTKYTMTCPAGRYIAGFARTEADCVACTSIYCCGL